MKLWQWMGLLSVTNGEPQQLPERQFCAAAEKQSAVTPVCVQTQCLLQCIYRANNEKYQKAPLLGVLLRLHVTIWSAFVEFSHPFQAEDSYNLRHSVYTHYYRQVCMASKDLLLQDVFNNMTSGNWHDSLSTLQL